MSDQTIFDDKKQEETPATPDNTQTDPFADKLQEIRNENGEPKYKDVETALSALKASQDYIKQLKGENQSWEEKYQSAKEELEKMGSIDDFVNRISPKKEESTPAPTQETPKISEGLSEEQVAKILEERLAAREQESAKAANLKRVIDHLQQAHGDKAVEYIQQKAQELGTTPAELKSLAGSNPQMVLRLLDSGEKQQPSKPTETSFLSNSNFKEENKIQN